MIHYQTNKFNSKIYAGNYKTYLCYAISKTPVDHSKLAYNRNYSSKTRHGTILDVF